ncbi:hypothetical protein BKA70DRAFT_1448179 [Coprinopsis sp. MPI-PUGE-AT-0042]|nr:hypothetical protein BKA70DRAFT_1448179 [Coprinopsis sp. MPI-PUGE-AT-0042]
MQLKEIARVQLPREIKGLVAEHCSPAHLATLVQVSREFQQEGERVLYANLSIDASRGPAQPLTNLAASPARATLVKSLHVQFGDFSLFGNPGYADLISGLPQMTNLVDLRVRLGWRDEEEMKTLEALLCAGRHFRLVTLFCDIRLDLEGIVEAQPTLRLLGTYSWGETAGVANWLISSPALRRRSLLVFSLERGSYLPYFSHLTFYQHPSEAFDSRSWTDLTTAIWCPSSGLHVGISVQDVECVTLFLTDTQHPTDGLSLMWSSISGIFPCVARLEVYSPSCHNLTARSTVEGIQLFTQMNEINIYKFPLDADWVDEDLRRIAGCVAHWSVSCPLLRVVTLGRKGVYISKLKDEWEMKRERYYE